MTENPNTQPDPNAGQPPGGPVGTPSTPSTPSTPATPATPAEPTPTEPAPTRPGGSTDAAMTEPAPIESAGQNADHTDHIEDLDHTENTEFAGPADPNTPNTGVAATFLPGIDAASVLALVAAALGAGAFLLVNPLVQAHDAARTWSDFKNNVPRTKQDPFGLQRDWVNFQSWAHIILGLVAVLLALLVLAMWTARGSRPRSRSFAQAALVLGLAVVLYGILLKTGAVGSEIPSMKDISTGLSTSSSQ